MFRGIRTFPDGKGQGLLFTGPQEEKQKEIDSAFDKIRRNTAMIRFESG